MNVASTIRLRCLMGLSLFWGIVTGHMRRAVDVHGVGAICVDWRGIILRPRNLLAAVILVAVNRSSRARSRLIIGGFSLLGIGSTSG